jgi:hypothetical protein
MSDDVPENADVCIIGHERVQGKAYRVRDDRVLGLMKAAKQRLGMKLKNNRLFVCEKHREEYMRKRKGFERNVLVLSALAAVFFVIIFVVNFSSGDVADILRALLLGVLLILVVPIFLIFTYVPAVEGMGAEKAQAKPQKRGGKK